jgi:hypothetical protein
MRAAQKSGIVTIDSAEQDPGSAAVRAATGRGVVVVAPRGRLP